MSFWELLKEQTIDPQQRLRGLLEMDRILGLEIASVEPEQLDPAFEAHVKELVDQREMARRAKDYARADEIRKQLRELGVVLEDTPEGPRWKKEKF